MSYYNSSNASMITVDSQLSNFFSYYSNQTQYFDSNALIESSNSSLDPQIIVYKIKLQGSNILNYSFELNSSSINFINNAVGSQAFEPTDIASIFYLMFYNSS